MRLVNLIISATLVLIFSKINSKSGIVQAINIWSNFQVHARAHKILDDFNAKTKVEKINKS